METILITVPQMWESGTTDLAVNGLPIDEWAKQQKDRLDEALHQEGFHVVCMTAYSYKGAEMMHYALEREEVQIKGDWNVRTEEPL